MRKNELGMDLVWKLSTVVIVLGMSAGLLTGCQLAKPEASETVSGAEQDRLVGVLVTTESLDLFDSEAWIEDNLEQIIDGGNMTVPVGEDEKYQGRIYASLAERTLYDEDGQAASCSHEYVFENIDGIMCYAAMVYEENGIDYMTSSADSGLYMTQNHIIQNDAVTSIELEGTIYVTAAQGTPVYYMYPLYQEADGDVYLTDGSGMSFDTDSEGGSMSMSYDEAVAVTDTNGKTAERSSHVEVTIEVVNRPERVVISQMDENSQVISREEYPAGQVPEKITPEANAEYIVVEMFKQGTEIQTVDRQLYDSGDDCFMTMAAREDGICEQIYTSIEWGK